MDQPFIHRPPTAKELERLRLILSTYQDGSGMLNTDSGTLPGWRDFERACALTFDGVAVESKFFVDVIFPLDTEEKSFYGIDCKMRGELRSADQKNKIYVEVTNASAALWGHLHSKGILNYRDKPELAGPALLEVMDLLKKTGSSAYPKGQINLDSSYYLVLLWETEGNYQLFQLPIDLPNTGDLKWTCHVGKKKGGGETTRLVGSDHNGPLYEWYGDSGGQLKYYPQVSSAVWYSEKFRLEPLPDDTNKGILAKAKAYFPDLWSLAASELE